MRSSVSDLENQPAPLPRAAGAHDRTKRPRNPALAPDHLADVFLRYMEAEDDRVVTHFLLDADGVGVVDELPRQIGEQVSQGS